MRERLLGNREGSTQGLAGFVAAERHRLFDGASADRREQLLAGERRAAVLAAWNKVVMGSREYAHVTGLHYAPESNELVVYLDAPSWTQEMSLMREIIRARMAACGGEVVGLVFRTSKEGYRSNAQRQEGRTPAKRAEPAPPRARRELSEAEEREVAAATAAVEPPALREALRAAMRANLGLEP